VPCLGYTFSPARQDHIIKGRPLVEEEPLASIDRDSYEPAYAQLVNILRRQIAAGMFRPGDRLPSEAQLCRRYGVSPMTVRRAINILADQGVVNTAQGRGTFVKPLELGAAAFDLQELQDLFGNAQTNVKILEARIALADERAARKLSITVGTRTIYLRRQLLWGEEPVLYHRAHLIYDPTRPLVEAEMEVTSLQGLFDGTDKAGLKNGKLTVEATVLNKEEAQLLQSSLGTPSFRIEHIFYDFDGRPVSWGWFICPGDRLRFTTTVGLPD
jgi:DNA-binding GntR family transcriptional regulator